LQLQKLFFCLRKEYDKTRILFLSYHFHAYFFISSFAKDLGHI